MKRSDVEGDGRSSRTEERRHGHHHSAEHLKVTTREGLGNSPLKHCARPIRTMS